MNATALAVIGCVCAVGTLALALIVHIIKFAEEKGHTRARIEALEQHGSTQDCKAELAVLGAKFEALEATLKEVAHDVKNLLTGRVVPARRSVSND